MKNVYIISYNNTIKCITNGMHEYIETKIHLNETQNIKMHFIRYSFDVCIRNDVYHKRRAMFSFNISFFLSFIYFSIFQL